MKTYDVVAIRVLALITLVSVVIVVLPILSHNIGLWNGFLAKETVFAKTTWLSRLAVVQIPTTTTNRQQSKVKIIACIGDSITEYGCVSNESMTYPNQMQTMLGDEYNVINFGVSARTMLKDSYCNCNPTISDPIYDDDNNCSYWKTDTFQNALVSNPDIVTIMLGTNDAKECNWYGSPNKGKGYSNESYIGYRSAYIEMVQLFQSLPSNPKVYLVIPPPLVNPPLNPTIPPPYKMMKLILNEIIPNMIPILADENDVTGGIIDTWTALGGIDGFENDTMTCDGCHPKDVAMTIIAQTFVNAILASDSQL